MMMPPLLSDDATLDAIAAITLIRRLLRFAMPLRRRHAAFRRYADTLHTRR